MCSRVASAGIDFLDSEDRAYAVSLFCFCLSAQLGRERSRLDCQMRGDAGRLQQQQQQQLMGLIISRKSRRGARSSLDVVRRVPTYRVDMQGDAIIPPDMT